MELRAQVGELEASCRPTRSSSRPFENDEASTRALAERLAKEKSALDKRRKDESGQAGAEIQKLSTQLDAARADAREENKKVQELERKLTESRNAGSGCRRPSTAPRPTARDPGQAGAAVASYLGPAELARMHEELNKARRSTRS